MSNLSDANFFSSVLLQLKKVRLQLPKLEFVRLSWGRRPDKLAIPLQNFAQVGLQLKFTFRIRPFSYLQVNSFKIMSLS